MCACVCVCVCVCASACTNTANWAAHTYFKSKTEEKEKNVLQL
jgi:hypothetical protein